MQVDKISVTDSYNVIEQLRQDVSTIGREFQAINAELCRTIANTNKLWHPKFLSMMEELQTRWKHHHEMFVSTIWKSRRVAGSAQAILLDFVDVCIPILFRQGISDEAKVIELENYDKLMEKNKEATEVNASLAELVEYIRVFERDWMKIRTTYKRLFKEDWISCKLAAIRARLTNVTTEAYTGKGVLSISMIFMQNTPAAAPTQINAAQADIGNLLTKLIAICLVWSAIRVDISEACATLKSLQSSATEEFHARRLAPLELGYRRLADVLRRYQVQIISDPQPNSQYGPQSAV